MEIVLRNNEYKISFRYDPKLIECIRAIPGRRWWPQERVWTVPAIPGSEKALEALGGLLPKKHIEDKTSPLDLTGFKRTLRKYQEEGVTFVEKAGGKALIGDDMGLGKTVQALAYFFRHREQWPALVICPATLKINWEREAIAAIPNIKTHIIEGKNFSYPLPKADLYIINYDIMTNKREKKKVFTNNGWVNKRIAIEKTGWMDHLPAFKMVILDECQKIANYSADRSKDILKFIKRIKPQSILPLSGTPITSRPIQFYNTLSLIANRRLPPYKTFGITYCEGKHNGFGWDFSGSSNEDKLHDLLTGVMIRRLKKDVLTELPDKTHMVIPFTMKAKDRKDYDKAERDILAWLKSIDTDKFTRAEKAKALAEFSVLKELARVGKFNLIVEWIKEQLEDTNEKFIIFGIRHDTIDKLCIELKNYMPVKLDGRDSMTKRQEAVDTFQNDAKCRVFIGQIKAAGEGITLTAATNVIFSEIDWTPAAHNQAEDRAHRIGQKNAVTVYYLLAQDTIEERIAHILDAKRKTLTQVLDGKDIEDSALISELLNNYVKEAS